MLFIRVSHHRYAIPVAQIRHVDYVDVVTPLPFLSAPIEGLTYFKEIALVQVNLAQALGHPDSHGVKRLIVSTPHGDIALRVDEVLNFEKISQQNTPEPTPSVLALQTLLPWTAQLKRPSLEKNHHFISRGNQHLSVLLVSSGNTQLALLTHSIDHIQEMLALETLERQSGQGDLLIRIRDHLLPTQSLAHLLGQQEKHTEGIAIIIRNVQQVWALLVERVLGIEQVYQVYSSGMDERGLWYVSQEGQIRELLDANHLAAKAITQQASAPRLWYVTPEGRIRELVEANQLLGTTTEPLSFKVSEPALTEPCLKPVSQTGSRGLQIDCGQSCYFVPLALVTRTLNTLNAALMQSARLKTASLPLLNAGMLFYGIAQPSHCVLLITLSDGVQCLIEVNQADLQPLLTAWKPLRLPAPAGQFFDRGVYNEDTRQWLLQINSDIRFAQLPWVIKKAIVNAIVGWFDIAVINEINPLP